MESTNSGALDDESGEEEPVKSTSDPEAEDVVLTNFLLQATALHAPAAEKSTETKPDANDTNASPSEEKKPSSEESKS